MIASIEQLADLEKKENDNRAVEIASDIVERCIDCGSPLDYRAGKGNPFCNNDKCRRYMIPLSAYG